jgi:N-acetylglucosamine-6-sulfatase
VHAARSTSAALLLLSAACANPPAAGDSHATSYDGPWNVVLILTDDQRPDTLWTMPNLQERVIEPGVLYNRAVTTSPLCVPTRSSLLSGGFLAQHTHVLNNTLPNGGIESFQDTETLPVRLQDAGYQTMLVGKYLNGYVEDWITYVPPGWSNWFGVISFNPMDLWTASIGSSGKTAGKAQVIRGNTYLTDYETELATDFVSTAEEPFFLYSTPSAPHGGASPPPCDQGLYTDFTWRGDGFNEDDVSDKPSWVASLDFLTNEEVRTLDSSVRNSLRTLPSIDRQIGAILDSLEARGVLDHTLFVFASDNGVHWGEHRYTQKELAYEPSIRVPLVLLAPGLHPGTSNAPVPVNLDVPATIEQVAGLEARSEGRSLLGDSEGNPPLERDRVFIESYPMHAPVLAAVTTDEWKYVSWTTFDEEGSFEEELYDLVADPAEAVNLAAAPPEAAQIDQLRADLRANRGLAVGDFLPPGVVVGEPYRYQVEPWGGTPPYTWSATELPAGLSIDQNGLISGTPTAVGSFRIVVEDSSVTPIDGKPERFTAFTSTDEGQD